MGRWADLVSSTGQDTVEEVVSWGAQAPLEAENSSLPSSSKGMRDPILHLKEQIAPKPSSFQKLQRSTATHPLISAREGDQDSS